MDRSCPRITSYNVCYTKLLRLGWDNDVDFGLFRHIDLLLDKRKTATISAHCC